MQYKDLKPEDKYFRQWSAYRKARNANFRLMAITYPIAAPVLTGMVWWLTGGKSVETFFIILMPITFIWAAFIATQSNENRYPCPNCGRQLSIGGCNDCGLPKWAPDEYVRDVPKKRKRSHAPVILHRSESSAVCPYCKTVIEPFDKESVRCLWCGTAHHQECWNQNTRCAIFNCPGTSTIKASPTTQQNTN